MWALAAGRAQAGLVACRLALEAELHLMLKIIEFPLISTF